MYVIDRTASARKIEVQDHDERRVCVSTPLHSRCFLSGVPRVVSQRTAKQPNIARGMTEMSP